MSICSKKCNLSITNIGIGILISYHSKEDHSEINEFLDFAPDSAIILSVTYALGFNGLTSLQLLPGGRIDSAHNHGTAMQTLGIIRRLGHPRPKNVVYYYECYLG